jgi:hypothetical protein
VVINKHFISGYKFKMVTSALMALFVSACGGGGDGEDNNVVTDYSLLAEYVFSIDRTVDPFLQPTDGLTVSADIDSTTASLRIDPHPVTGTYQCDPATDECALATIGTGTFLDVFDETGTPVIGDLEIRILEQVIISTSGQPIIGKVQIRSLPAPDGLGEGFLELEMDTCPGGAPGVNIYDNSVLLGCYAWDAFENLFDTSSVLEEQLASFGFQVLGFLFAQVDLVVQGLGRIDESETALEQTGPVNEMCDAFSTAGLTAPTGIPDAGTVELSWSDSDSNNEVSPGDGFLLIFDNCWIDDPTDDIDDLLDGQLEFAGYTDVVDNTREVITRIGFEPGVGPTTGGVFYYGSFTASETEETMPGMATITDVVGIAGGVSVVFSEP